MKTTLRRAFCFVSLVVFSWFAVGTVGVSASGLPKEQSQIYKNQIFRFTVNEEDCSPADANGGTGVTDGSGVDRFLQVLAQQESNGNPKAANPGSSARGKYQYLTSTWHSSAKANYPPADAYSTADAAPESYQDAVAKIEYTKKFVQFNSDLFKLAISHFYPAANSNPAMLDAKIGSNSITPRQYANSVVSKINAGVGIGIGMHYSEAPQFAEFFAKISSGPGSAPVATQVGDTTATTSNNSCGDTGGNGAVTGDCGDKTLRVPPGGTGVNICYFNQADFERSPYNWPGCGCLPTSMLEIRATMEKSPNLDHNEVLKGFRAAGGVFSDGCSGVIGGALSYLKGQGYTVNTILGRTSTVNDSDLAKVKEALGQGFLVLTHTGNPKTNGTIDSAGRSPTDGHFLVIHAVDANGNFYVANPGARADNGKAVSPTRMKAWLTEFYAVKK